LAVVLAFQPAAVGADGLNSVGYAGGHTDGSGAQVVVVTPGRSSGSAGTSGQAPGGGAGGPASTVECRYFSATASWGTTEATVGQPVTDTASFEDGALVWLLCRDATTGVIVEQRVFTWDPANPPPLAPSAAVLAQMAANRLQLPLPTVRTWPPTEGRGLVHLPVWLHLENWEPVTASAAAGGLTATVKAVPVRVEWDMDDGSVMCTDAGSVYDPTTDPEPSASTCSFTYRRSSVGRVDGRFHNTATVTWRLAWTATNGQGADLGELTGPTADFSLRIHESQALIAP
jgi:hypothetical protein